jgi:hypothetical protein
VSPEVFLDMTPGAIMRHVDATLRVAKRFKLD